MKALWLVAASLCLLGCPSSSPSGDAVAWDARLESRPGERGSRDAAPSDGVLRDGPVAPGCGKGEWCWVNPLPHGNRYNGISVAPGGAMFAVGEAGAAIRSTDGQSWASLPAGEGASLAAVWAFSYDDAIAVGVQGTVLRFGSGKWTAEPTPSGLKQDFTAIWASGPADVFVVGGQGTALHHDGSAWTKQSVTATSVELDSVWGTGPADDVYAVGGGSIHRFQRTTAAWTATSLPAGSYNCLWRLPSGPTFVGGNGSDGRDALLELQGTNVTAYTSNAYVGVAGIWGRSASEVYLVGDSDVLRFDGFQVSSMAAVTLTRQLTGVSGSSDSLVISGAGGAVLRVKGTALQKLQPSTTLLGQSLGALAGRNDKDVVAVGDDGVILHFDGAAWGKQTSPTVASLNAVWLGKGIAVAVGEGGTIVIDSGSGWAKSVSPVSTSLRGVWGSSPTDVHAVGADGILHYDGQSWTKVAPSTAPGSLNAIWGSGPNDIYTVGGYGTLFHFDGTWHKHTTISGGDEPIRCLWGRAAGELYAGGDYGSIYRGDGSTWNSESGAIGPVHAISGAGSATYAVGNGAVARNDGAGWVKVPAGCRNQLYAVWGDATRVWVAGDYGTLLRYEP
jgi:hypothetical protein